MPDNQKKPWVKLTFLDTVSEEPTVGQLISETPDAYALQNTIDLDEDSDEGATIVVPTHLRFYQKHCVFCMEIIDNPVK